MVADCEPPELWDVVGINGVATGEVFARGSGPLPKGSFHVVSTVCAVRPDGTVLLTQRAASKEFPLTWELPGGSALAGESSLEAALRELSEETEIAAAKDQAVLVGRHVEESALVDLYLVRLDTGAEAHPDPTEIHDFAWVSLEEVRRRLHSGHMAPPWVQRMRTLWERLAASV